jgi:hypothetical protein
MIPQPRAPVLIRTILGRVRRIHTEALGLKERTLSLHVTSDGLKAGTTKIIVFWHFSLKLEAQRPAAQGLICYYSNLHSLELASE